MKYCACLLTLALAWPAGAYPDAQDDAGSTWYQVELIIFTNSSTQSGSDEEWPLVPELSYPSHRQYLKRGASKRVPLPVADAASVELGSRQKIDLLWHKTTDQLWREWNAKVTQLNAGKEPSVESLPDPGQPEPTADEQEAVPFDPASLDIPAAFVLLDETHFNLLAESKRIQRRAEMQVLFHQTWLQPMWDRESSPAIVIGSDESRGAYPLLQGSIELYAERYLHIASDLWLNTDGDYLPGDWRMPAPPLQPAPSSADESAFRVQLTPGWMSAENAIDVSRPLAGNIIGTPAPGLAESALEPHAWFSGLDYRYRHAIPVRNSRRMRSGELHYLDHPELGILIQVNVHEFEPFAAWADAVNAQGQDTPPAVPQ